LKEKHHQSREKAKARKEKQQLKQRPQRCWLKERLHQWRAKAKARKEKEQLKQRS